MPWYENQIKFLSYCPCNELIGQDQKVPKLLTKQPLLNWTLVFSRGVLPKKDPGNWKTAYGSLRQSKLQLQWPQMVKIQTTVASKGQNWNYSNFTGSKLKLQWPHWAKPQITVTSVGLHSNYRDFRGLKPKLQQPQRVIIKLQQHVVAFFNSSLLTDLFLISILLILITIC